MLRSEHGVYNFSASTRWLASGPEDARRRWTLDKSLNPRLTVGLEYTPSQNEVLPRATWFATPAKGSLPSVALGWTSDRLSTPKGQAVFMTFSQHIPESPVTLISSLKWSTDKSRLAFPFGANLKLGDQAVLQAIHDGDYTHLLLTRIERGWSASFVLARTRYPGMHFSYQF